MVIKRGEIWWAELPEPSGFEPANVSQLITVDKSFLTDKVHTLSGRLMAQIDNGIRLVLKL